jgi:hypothetical protein
MGNDIFGLCPPAHDVLYRIFHLGYAGHPGPVQSELFLHQSETGIEIQVTMFTQENDSAPEPG